MAFAAGSVAHNSLPAGLVQHGRLGLWLSMANACQAQRYNACRFWRGHPHRLLCAEPFAAQSSVAPTRVKAVLWRSTFQTSRHLACYSTRQCCSSASGNSCTSTAAIIDDVFDDKAIERL